MPYLKRKNYYLPDLLEKKSETGREVLNHVLIKLLLHDYLGKELTVFPSLRIKT